MNKHEKNNFQYHDSDKNQTSNVFQKYQDY